ncbi:MAG TPA: hypothetical protein VL134_04735, partial [Leptolyngbya sp.]|nr:hypothetical protein [Leptolyngbya sp.]
MNTEKVFQLIDRVLPFEACLFHQILPLSIEDGKLHLGMVMLDDVAALDYARRMAGYQNYALIPQSLSSETHHTTLTAYLKYNQTHPQVSAPPTQKLPEPPKKLDLHAKETFVVESPDELEAQECHQPAAAHAFEPTLGEAQSGLPSL